MNICTQYISENRDSPYCQERMILLFVDLKYFKAINNLTLSYWKITSLYIQETLYTSIFEFTLLYYYNYYTMLYFRKKC